MEVIKQCQKLIAAPPTIASAPHVEDDSNGKDESMWWRELSSSRTQIGHLLWDQSQGCTTRNDEVTEADFFCAKEVQRPLSMCHSGPTGNVHAFARYLMRRKEHVWTGPD